MDSKIEFLTEGELTFIESYFDKAPQVRKLVMSYRALVRAFKEMTAKAPKIEPEKPA